MTPPATTEPLFAPRECGPLRAARDALVRDLLHVDDRAFPFSRACAVPDAADLASGRAGLAVACAHLGRPQAAVDHLEAALAGAARMPFAPRFFAGTTGTAWAATHVAHLLGGPDADDPVAEVDDAVLATLAAGTTRPFDLTAGLVGLGLYALERQPRPAARAMLTAVVARLAERAVVDERGARWCAAPGSPADLGMAHGVPGVVALLAASHAAGIGTARPLLDRAVAWLREQPRVPGPGVRYRKWRGGPVARQGWCYGAPGIACALLAAAQAAGEPDWRAAALELAERAAATPPALCRIVDAGLCHGAAGVAHLYHRLHRATGRPALRDAARAWFGRVLAMRRAGRGLGGYVSWFPRPGHRRPWVVDAGLVTGAAGVALALHAATGDGGWGWDRLLLPAAPVWREVQPTRARAATRAARER